VDDFEQWVTVLLLDGMQRAGYFKAVGESVSAGTLKQKVHRSYVRFIDEALSALCYAGQLLHCPHMMHAGFTPEYRTYICTCLLGNVRKSFQIFQIFAARCLQR